MAWIAAAVAVFYSLSSIALALLFFARLRVLDDRLSVSVALVLPVTGTLPGLEVTGVVANTPIFVLADPNPMPQLYMPMSIASGPDAHPLALIGPNAAVMSYVVRSRTPVTTLLGPVRRAVDTGAPYSTALFVGRGADVRHLVRTGQVIPRHSGVMIEASTIRAGVRPLIALCQATSSR